MSNVVATNQAPTARATNVALWVLQAVLAFQFAGGGLLKLTGSPEMVDLFTAIGAGQWLRYLVGALEVAGAVGLLIHAAVGPGRARAGRPAGGCDRHQPVRPRREPVAADRPAAGEHPDRPGPLVPNQGPGRPAPALTPRHSRRRVTCTV
jgi:hypothetical protein